MEEPHSRYRRLVCRAIKVFAVAASEVTFAKRNFRDFYDSHSLGNLPRIYFRIKLSPRSPGFAAGCCRGVTNAFLRRAAHENTVAPRLFAYFFRDKSISVAARCASLARCESLPEVADERYIKKGCVERAGVARSGLSAR